MTLNVLIVEDDPKIAEIHRHYTEKVEGFSVCGIADCLADAKVAATLMEPDLILLDLYFPEGLGLEILWQVRSRRQSTDVILVTAAKEIQHLQDAIRGGAFDYIVKPVMFPRFKETLLKFRKHREGLERGDLMDQVHVDRLLHPFKESPAGAPEYPKGVDPLTLKRIEAIFDQSRPDGLSAEEVGETAGVSRTTARRYLEYLTTIGKLDTDLVYGAVGRPERKYIPL